MRSKCVIKIVFVGWAVVAATASALAASMVPLDPISLTAVADARSHVAQLGIALSPDSEWIARSYRLEGLTVERANAFFTETGSTVAFGDSQLQTALTNTNTGEVVTLGPENASVWGAAWSPDGKRVAYYSDQGGLLGLWIWERSTRQSWKFPGVIPRPWANINLVQWADGNRHLICKILPGGMTLAEANVSSPKPRAQSFRLFPPHRPGQASFIELSNPRPVSAPGNTPATDELAWSRGDLAVLDLDTRSVTRIVQGENVWFYNPSPDSKYIAYAIDRRVDGSTYQNHFDVRLYDFAAGTTQTLLRDAPLDALKWSWSPDAAHIAFVVSPRPGHNRILVVSVPNGTPDLAGDGPAPRIEVGNGDVTPVWEPNSEHVLAVAGGDLWRFALSSAYATQITTDPDLSIMTVVPLGTGNAIWSPDGGQSAIVTAHQRGGLEGLVRIDLATGIPHPLHLVKSEVLTAANVTAAAQAIAYVTQDIDHRPDAWLYDPKRNSAKPVTVLNPGAVDHARGDVRVIDWRVADGRTLYGALLLPPGYRAGTRLPCVVWVYGGALGSRAIDTPGLAQDNPAFNMEVLATRGYAVLFPDAPVRTGSTSADLLVDVMPGVDMVISLGFADPDRLAVMGQSYGSYSAFALITQTNRFKAAIVSGVIHQDYLSGYLTLDSDGTAGEAAWYESGQGAMGGTPWQFPERYIQNSPIWAFDKIETPILMAVGTADITSASAPDAVFAALQRLGKPIDYVVYEGEGHVIQSRSNVLDFWKRRLEFLALHLNLKANADGAVLFRNGRAMAARNAQAP